MTTSLSNCTLCAHSCKINRFQSIGRCKSTDTVKIGLSELYFYEEPCISGSSGSGAIFFSNCNFNCIYCQNYQISQLGKGNFVSVHELSKIFLNLQEKGAHNINLVTPTSYVFQIIEALDVAKSHGLSIPIIYNTNSYDSLETINLLNNYIDVYLPDLKYFDNTVAQKYSKVDNYFDVATKAINAMYAQVGKAQFDEQGLITKGVIIRHLILPGHMQNTKNILTWIKSNMPSDVYVSIMAQYFPTYKACEDKIINRALTYKEYSEIIHYIDLLDFENGYIQELGSNEESYVPKF